MTQGSVAARSGPGYTFVHVEKIRYRKGIECGVVVSRQGIAVRRVWQGTKLVPWELIGAVNLVQASWLTHWSIQITLVDGSVFTLPVLTATRVEHLQSLRTAVADMHRIWREVQAERSDEPADQVPWQYRAAEVRELGYRGGIARNGVLLLALAVFGLLGVLLMSLSTRADFGSFSLAGAPGVCTAAASDDGSAAHSWCSVTDARVHEIDHEQGGGLILWLGPAQFSQQDPETDAEEVEFAATVPALSALRVGDPIDYLAQSGVGIASVTVQGTTVAADTQDGGALDGTVGGQRTADDSGLIGAVCWPLFFGVWAACQRWPRKLAFARWALPVLAAAWLAGVIGFCEDHGTEPTLTPGGIVRLGLVFAVIATVCYTGAVALRTRPLPFLRSSAHP